MKILRPFAALVSLLFLSCISVESKMTLAADGSGTLELLYTVSALARDWENADKNVSTLPLPINEDDFRRSVAAVPGLSLQSWSLSENGDSILIRAVLGFNSLEALNSFTGGSGSSCRLTRENGRSVFEQTISTGGAAATDERTQQFIEAFFKTNSLSFSLTAPAAIARTSPPEARFSGRQASVSFPLSKVMRSREAIIWKVEW